MLGLRAAERAEKERNPAKWEKREAAASGRGRYHTWTMDFAVPIEVRVA